MMTVTRVYTMGGQGVTLEGNLCDFRTTTGFFYFTLPLAYYTIQQFECLVNTRLNYKWAEKPNDFKKMLAIHKERMKSIVTRYVSVQMFTKNKGSLLQTICKSTAADAAPISKDLEIFLHEGCRWEDADTDKYAHPSIFFRTLGVCSLQSAIDFSCETQNNQNKTYTTLLSTYPIGTQIAIQQYMKKLAGNAAYTYLYRTEAPTSTRTEEEQVDSDQDEDLTTSMSDMLCGAAKSMLKQVRNSVWVVSIDSIASVTVITGGSGYTDTPQVTIVSPTGGDGHTTKLVTTVTNHTDGIVKTITIETHGSGFIDDPMVDITTSDTRNVPSGIVLRDQMGSFLCITVPVSGVGYTSPPNVKIVGGGQTVTLTAASTAVFENGCVTVVLLTNVGSGYTEAPTVTIESTNGVGSDTQSVATVILQTSF